MCVVRVSYVYCLCCVLNYVCVVCVLYVVRGVADKIGLFCRLGLFQLINASFLARLVSQNTLLYMETNCNVSDLV